MAKKDTLDIPEDFQQADSSSALDSLLTEDEKPKRGRRKKKEVVQPSLEIKGEQVALFTSGLLAVLEATTKMPFRSVEKEVKQPFDDSLAQCATIYGGEYMAKYMPIVQLSLCATLMVTSTYQKHLENKKKANLNNDQEA